MKLRGVVGACVGALLLSTSSGAFAEAGMTSVNIVEPKLESKWGYAPAAQQVEPGTWITWSNAGQDPHTVTAVDGSFDSGNLDPSEGFSWFFADPGTFHVRVHAASVDDGQGHRRRRHSRRYPTARQRYRSGRRPAARRPRTSCGLSSTT